MRIAVDAATWTNGRGYGRFVREILGAAARLEAGHRFVLVGDAGSLPVSTDAFDVVHADVRVPPGIAASVEGYRSLRDLAVMSRALVSASADCIFFPTVYTYVPVLTRTPVVVGIHDVIPERLPGHVFPTARSRRLWTAKVRAAVFQAARVMTVSRHAMAGIVDRLRVDPSRVRIVQEAPAAIFTKEADPAPGAAALRAAGQRGDARFLLYVGGLAPHKNLGALVHCVQALADRSAFADVILVIVGDYEHDVFYSAYPQLRAQAARGGDRRVVFTGRLDDEAVAGLMRLAQALVLPSLDEGFGLPGIEAAACGTAVVATRNSALPEVLGDAALYIDPRDEASLLSALERVLGDASLRASLGARGAERARLCTWDVAGRSLLDIFEELGRSR
jgi:glycosyltransferase involved in cell wall biosynthesis